jgi:hypothetical protein
MPPKYSYNRNVLADLVHLKQASSLNTKGGQRMIKTDNTQRRPCWETLMLKCMYMLAAIGWRKVEEYTITFVRKAIFPSW